MEVVITKMKYVDKDYRMIKQLHISIAIYCQKYYNGNVIYGKE